MRENISKLEDRLDRLESALDHRKNNLSKLEDMRDSAWSDSFRDRVEEWIDEENARISDIESKIDQIKGWISDIEAKLR
jgi:chromosome segregation ATPase